MINFNTEDILETINMIREENLDIRTITVGISLLIVFRMMQTYCARIYDKINRTAENLIKTGEDIEKNTVYR